MQRRSVTNPDPHCGGRLPRQKRPRHITASPIGRKGGSRPSDSAAALSSNAPAAQLQRRAERGLLLLRLCLIAALVLLIGVSLTSYADMEQMVQNQQTLNASYRLRSQLQDVTIKINEAQTANALYARTGLWRYRYHASSSLAAARGEIEAIRSAPISLRLWGESSETADIALRADTLLADAGTNNDSYDEALTCLRQILLQQTPKLVALGDQVQEAAMREREYVWMRTCGMIALLGVAFLLLWRDTTLRDRQEQALRSANRTLARLAEQDSLTRLNNRRALEEKLRQEWTRSQRSGSPLSLLFVDVDRFKQYNDSFGHLAGDEVLRTVAALLQNESRSTDFVARYGGEEFAVLLPNTDASEARIVGDRLRHAFEGERWPGRAITASVGVATLSPDAENLDALLYEADIALYFAKHNGRNRVAHADEVVKIK